MGIQPVQTATVYLYKNNGTLVDSSAIFAEDYKVSAPKGEYYYVIDDEDKGNVRGDIILTEESFSETTISQQLYDACDDFDVTVEDIEGDPVSNIKVKIDTLFGKNNDDGTYSFDVVSLTKVPQKTCLVQINTDNVAYERWKDEIEFDEDSTDFTVELSPTFGLRIQFLNNSVNVTSSITFCRIRYIYSTGNKSAWLNLTQGMTFYFLANDKTYSGDIEIEITSENNYTLNPGQEFKTVTYSEGNRTLFCAVTPGLG